MLVGVELDWVDDCVELLTLDDVELDRVELLVVIELD